MRISDWSSDLCSSDLCVNLSLRTKRQPGAKAKPEAPTGHTKGRSPAREQGERPETFTGVTDASMKRIANTLAACRTHRDRRLATARRMLIGEQLGEAAHGLGSTALCRSEEPTSELQSLMRIS